MAMFGANKALREYIRQAGMRSDTLPTSGDYFGPPDIGGPPCTRTQTKVRPPPEVQYSNLFKNYNHERDAHKYKPFYTRRISDLTPESLAFRRLSTDNTGEAQRKKNFAGDIFDDIVQEHEEPHETDTCESKTEKNEKKSLKYVKE